MLWYIEQVGVMSLVRTATVQVTPLPLSFPRSFDKNRWLHTPDSPTTEVAGVLFQPIGWQELSPGVQYSGYRPFLSPNPPALTVSTFTSFLFYPIFVLLTGDTSSQRPFYLSANCTSYVNTRLRPSHSHAGKRPPWIGYSSCTDKVLSEPDQ